MWASQQLLKKHWKPCALKSILVSIACCPKKLSNLSTDAAHFLSKVTSSMLNARRSQPTPVDFKYALAEFNLPITSIEPHLSPPIPASKLHIQLDALPAEELTADCGLPLLGEELSGQPDKQQKAYIPKRFPSFPSKHTYKWTEKESARETDPRKIREEAAKVARQGEEALRRLTKMGKAGKERDVKKAASKDPRSKARHGMWEKAVDDLMVNTQDSASRAAGERDDRSMVVNADRPYLRKGAPAKKKALPLEIHN
jgi:transcription initiation factor TFIID subunit 8